MKVISREKISSESNVKNFKQALSKAYYATMARRSIFNIAFFYLPGHCVC